jgi:hypothetical protein
MALVNASGAVVEFLSYEGTFTAVSGARTVWFRWTSA